MTTKQSRKNKNTDKELHDGKCKVSLVHEGSHVQRMQAIDNMYSKYPKRVRTKVTVVFELKYLETKKNDKILTKVTLTFPKDKLLSVGQYR